VKQTTTGRQECWEGWELSLFNRLKDIERIKGLIIRDMMGEGMTATQAREFLNSHISDMQEQIQEQIAAEKAAGRKKKAV
jgi:hypothetical protein